MKETAHIIASTCNNPNVVVLIVGDGDKAGQKGAQAAAQALVGCRRLRLAPPDGQDISDMWRHQKLQPTKNWAWADSLEQIALSELNRPLLGDDNGRVLRIPEVNSPQPSLKTATTPPNVTARDRIWPQPVTPDGYWTVTVKANPSTGDAMIVAAEPERVNGDRTNNSQPPDGGWVPSPKLLPHLNRALTNATNGTSCLRVRVQGNDACLVPI